MQGLEKVTGKIMADAEADARAIRERAEASCASLVEQYKAATERELESLREASDRECQALIIRAKSSAVMARRNALLEARAEVLDSAYAAAEQLLRSMSGEAYLDLLSKMLRTALKDQLEAEDESLRLYGEDISPDAYEVLLCSRDLAAYGDKLLLHFRAGLGSKFSPRALAKLRVSAEAAPIDGGLILRCGPVETNCSFAMLLAENRRETEARVSSILFGEGAPAEAER